MPENSHAERTDSFEEKLRLIESAWRKKDFRLARSLAHSLRHSAIQAQAEEENPGKPLGPTNALPVESLPARWRAWARGWKFFRVIHLDDTLGLERAAEPVELSLSADESHHLVAVNRAQPGDTVVAFDGRGTEWICELVGARKNAAVLGYNYPGSDWYRDAYAIVEGKPMPAAASGNKPWYRFW